MLLFVALLILAVLLFGASAFLGMLGAVLGIIAFVAACIAAASAFDVDPYLLTFIAFIAIVIFGLWAISSDKKERTAAAGRLDALAEANKAIRHAEDVRLRQEHPE